MAEEQKKQSIHLKVEPDKEQGSYSNAVSVHVTHNEVILDFGYLIPNQSPVTIKLTNRVNLTHRTAESLMKTLSNAMLDWRNNQASKEENKEQNNE